MKVQAPREGAVMNHHQYLILDVADLNDAVAEPLTTEGMAAMVLLVDAMAARLAQAAMPASQPG